MDKTEFVKYDDVVKILNENDYYGLIVKRLDKQRRRMIHTFSSIKWYTIDIEVESLKLDGEKIVIGIKFDGEEINGIDNFKRRIKGVSGAHAAKRKQTLR